MFFEAQRRFRENQVRGNAFVSDYTRDVLRNYGDRGKKINLPQESDAAYQRALQFRDREKQHYKQLTAQLRETQRHLDYMRNQNLQYRERIVQFPITDTRKKDDRGRGHRGDSVSDSGAGVLPPESDPTKVHSHLRQPEAIISSTESVADEPPNRRANRSRRNDAQQQPDETGSATSTQRADAGGSLPDAADGPEPDVGGPADQHSAAE